MSAPKRHNRCSVLGCNTEHGSLYKLPASEPLRTKWLQFIYDGDIPKKIGKAIYVCSNHFTSDCFINEGQFIAGFAQKLIVKEGSIPTYRTPDKSVSWSERKKDVSCQTDAPSRRTVHTQLSHRTVLSYRSKGTQTQQSKTTTIHPTTSQPSASTPLQDETFCCDVEVEEEFVEEEFEEEEFGICDTWDTTCDPTESVNTVTDSSKLSIPTTESAHEDRKYVVFESCLLELFETCPVCTRSCEVQHISTETFVAFDQLCTHCQYFRQWKSQLIL